ncbi:MAG: LytTR family DNA-binding domain-containing protein [Rikenellaceae bacterium]|nr:LytTR family DNA-binding domain-containing protein [Rikenellaceae bacterium]
MKCIIVDDEPLARRAMEFLIDESSGLELAGQFPDAVSAGNFMKNTDVDLVFLDIKMPGINGLEFAKTIPEKTLVVFTTAFAEYALDSYEVDAIDYLVKPVEKEKFDRAVTKALSYRKLFDSMDASDGIETLSKEYMYVKSERRYYKIMFSELLYIEGLKDYVILHLPDKKIITRKNLKTIYDILPGELFLRVNKSYIVNTEKIDSFYNNDIFIGRAEIPIGHSYRDNVFSRLLSGVE